MAFLDSIDNFVDRESIMHFLFRGFRINPFTGPTMEEKEGFRVMRLTKKHRYSRVFVLHLNFHFSSLVNRRSSHVDLFFAIRSAQDRRAVSFREPAKVKAAPVRLEDPETSSDRCNYVHKTDFY